MEENLTWSDPAVQQQLQVHDADYDKITSAAEDDYNAANAQKKLEMEAGLAGGENAGPPQGFIADNPLQAVQEVGTAIVGGGADAIDSVGSFLGLVGDSAQTAINKLTGVVDEANDPGAAGYSSKENAWWDIPDEWVPENKSGLGQITRGLVEFGVLAYATGGVGGTTAKGVTAARSLYKVKRVAGMGKKGARMLSFFPRLPYIAGEGAIAELISQSSEYGNIANLINEHAPWVPFSEALAVDPEDNPWLARIKTAMTGVGMNILGHFIVGYAKGAYKAHRLRKKGVSEVDANIEGNKVIQEEIDNGLAKDEAAHNEMAALEKGQGKGIADRNYRLEYNEKWLDYYDLDEYHRILDGEDATQPYINQILEKNPGVDPKLYDAQVMNNSVLDLLDEQADRFGRREEDPWFKKFGKSFKQLGEDEVDGLREPAPFTDADQFNSAEKATIRPDVGPDVKPDQKPTNYRNPRAKPIPNKPAVIQNIKESAKKLEITGNQASSPSSFATETALKNMSLGNKSIREVIQEVIDDLVAKTISESNVGGLDHATLARVAIAQTSEIYKIISGGNPEKAFKKWLMDPSKKNRIDWGEVAGVELGVTARPESKLAMQVVIHTLAEQVSAIAASTVDLPKGMTRARQQEMIYDAMQVLLTEHKKVGYLSGHTLNAQKIKLMTPVQMKEVNKGLRNIEIETKRYIDEVKKLALEGNADMANDLLKMYQLSGGSVTTFSHIGDFLHKLVRKRGLLYDGQVNGNKVMSRWQGEGQSTMYNSMLSGPKTPIKANVSTILISILRPYQAWIGAKIGGQTDELAIAAAQIDGMGQAWAEGIKMWKHNWDLGLNRETLTYPGRFDVAKDMQNFAQLEQFYQKYGSPSDQAAYGFLKNVSDFNNSPWVRTSQNMMGAGDAMARTIIGRQQLRMDTARAGLARGVDPTKLSKWALENEEEFRKQIFSKNKNEMWVVTNEASRMAGNEATMTTALPKMLQSFEQIQQLPIGRLFFPFVRTGFNAIRLTWAHTDLERMVGKHQDIMNWTPAAGDSIPMKYGINPANMPAEQALIRGRIATGRMAVGMASILAAGGMITGDAPRDRATRDLWERNGIKPNSFKIGNLYVSYEHMEPFNTIWSATANLLAHADVLGEDEFTEYGEKLGWMAMNVIVDKTMLSGLVDLADIFQLEEGGSQKLTRFMAKAARNQLPWAGLFGSIGDMMSANKREHVTMLQEFAKRDAIVKHAIPPKYDVLAKDRSGIPYSVPIGLYPPLLRIFNALSPIAVTMPQGDPIKEGLLAISYNMPDAITTYRGQELNAQERSRFQYYLATGDLRKNLEKVMTPAWYESVEKFKKTGLLKSDGIDVKKNKFYMQVHKEFVKAKKKAWMQMQAEYPELDTKVKDRVRKNQLLERGKYDYLLNTFPK